jgi:hypothetical protein
MKCKAIKKDYILRSSEKDVRRLAAWIANTDKIEGWEEIPLDQLILELQSVGIIAPSQKETSWPQTHY